MDYGSAFRVVRVLLVEVVRHFEPRVAELLNSFLGFGLVISELYRVSIEGRVSRPRGTDHMN